MACGTLLTGMAGNLKADLTDKPALVPSGRPEGLLSDLSQVDLLEQVSRDSVDTCEMELLGVM